MKLPPYHIVERRQSLRSVLPRKFAYIDYRLIGTHELPRVANTTLVYDSLLQLGYQGPAISVFYAYSDDPLSKIIDGSLLHIGYGEVGVADGHNRLEALRLLDMQGYLRSPYIPVQLVPAHDAELIYRIHIDDPAKEPLPLSVVENCFAEPMNIIPVINSCFTAKITDGSWVRVRDAQPDIVISKDNLLSFWRKEYA